MNVLTPAILILMMILTGNPVAMAMAKREVSVNQVVKMAVESRKSAMVDSINKRLQGKNLHRGLFFKGKIAEIKQALGILKRTTPRVVESSKGFIIMAGKGKNEWKVEVELVDPLTGKIKIAGEIVQLKKGMSYLQLAQTIAAPILKFFPIPKRKQKVKKTSFLNPIDLLFVPAWGKGDPLSEEESETVKKLIGVVAGGSAVVGTAVGGAAAVGVVSSGAAVSGAAVGATIGVSGAVVGGVGVGGGVISAGVATGAASGVVGAGVATGVAKIAAALGLGLVTIKIIAGTAVVLTAAVLGDTVGYEAYRLLSDEDNTAIKKTHDYFKRMLVACKDRRSADQQDEDFKQLWALTNELKNLTSQGKAQAKLGCHRLASMRDLDDYLNNSQFLLFWLPDSYALSNQIFRWRIRHLCKTYNEIINCFANAPNPFGEEVNTREAAINHGRQIKDGKFLGLFESLKASVLD